MTDDPEYVAPSRCSHPNIRAAYGLILYPGEKKERNKSMGKVCPDCRTFFPKVELLPILRKK